MSEDRDPIYLPQEAARDFAARNGIGKEIESILRASIAGPNTRGRRTKKGYILELFRQRGLLDGFIDEYWPAARTAKGKKIVATYERRRLDHIAQSGAAISSSVAAPSSSIAAPSPAPTTIEPPVDRIDEILARIRVLPGLPERNHEDVVKELLVRLGFAASSIIFQAGRLDLSILGKSGKPVAVFEVKTTIKGASKHDGALRQGMDYAMRTGAKIVVVTDGDRYAIYDRRKGDDYDSILCGRFQLTAFRLEDRAILDLLRPAFLLEV